MRTILSVLLPLSYLYASSITAVGDVMFGSSYPDPTMLDSCSADTIYVLHTIPKAPVENFVGRYHQKKAKQSSYSIILYKMCS